MTAIDHERLSRVVSHALRHERWLYELELDEELEDIVDSFALDGLQLGDVGSLSLHSLILVFMYHLCP